MQRYDPSTYHDTLDESIARTTDEHHLAILKNFRRHSLLEAAGRWPDIFTPELTVAEPVYRLSNGDSTLVLDGLKEVTDWYASLATSPLRVLWGPIDYKIMVGDWGFTAHGTFGQQWDGQLLIDQGNGMFGGGNAAKGFESIESIDPDAHYNINETMVMLWLYDDKAKLIGELTYDDPASREIEKMDPADVLSVEEAERRLVPWWVSEFGQEWVDEHGLNRDPATVK
jgi:hypothetical protein